MRGRGQRRYGQRRLGALGATALALALGFLALIGWLSLAGAPPAPPKPMAVSLAIPPPPAPPAAPQALPAASAPPPPASSGAASLPAAPAGAKPAMPEGGKEAPPAPPGASGAAEAPATASPSASAPSMPAPSTSAPSTSTPSTPAPGAASTAPAAPATAPAAAASGNGAARPAATKAPPPTQVALIPAPAPGLVEEGALGPLPRIAPDGRAPWRVYARPFDAADTRPRIALVIGNLGLSDAATEAAIQQLPGGVTLAFSPYSHKLDRYIPLARAAGHEVLLSLPMEPVSYPVNDPGPRALLTALTPAENMDRLTWLLSRFTGYVGVTNYMGSRFTTSDRDMRPILAELHKRGLLFFDSRSASQSIGYRLAGDLGLPTAANERFIDAEASRPAIDQMLLAVEEEAKQKGRSIAMGFPYPVTIERVAAWAEGLPGKGFVLAPVSAMVHARSEGNG